MEYVAEEVQTCLSHTQYGGKPCLSLHGIGEQNFLFNDETDLITFLVKSKCLKNEDVAQYKPIKNDLWKEVSTLWGLDEEFTGSYREDYQVPSVSGIWCFGVGKSAESFLEHYSKL